MKQDDLPQKQSNAPLNAVLVLELHSRAKLIESTV
jgi:hypothetical protein